MDTAIQISLPRPHSPGQLALLDTSYNDVAFCGRRWGKTQAGVYRILRAATSKPGLYWWVGLSWRSASMKRAWRLLKFYVAKIYRALNKRPENYINESNKEIVLPNGSSIWMRSAERPDSLAGEGIHGLVVDEFPFMAETVWQQFLEPTLMDYTGAWALFIGVPNGENWGSALWRMAKQREGWRQHHYTIYDNPLISIDKIEDTRLNVPERIFNQEYMAQVLTDGGNVFRRVSDAVRECYQDGYTPPHSYVIGCDWGQSNDYSVFAVMSRHTKEIVHMERMREIDYMLQLERLKALCNRFRPDTVIVESNSIGTPLAELLERSGLPIQRFMTTASSKREIIEQLAVAFENSQIGIYKNDILIDELIQFTMKRLPSGTFRYEAPEGAHDDCVMATALANHLCQAPVFEFADAPDILFEWRG